MNTQSLELSRLVFNNDKYVFLFDRFKHLFNGVIENIDKPITVKDAYGLTIRMFLVELLNSKYIIRDIIYILLTLGKYNNQIVRDINDFYVLMLIYRLKHNGYEYVYYMYKHIENRRKKDIDGHIKYNNDMRNRILENNLFTNASYIENNIHGMTTINLFENLSYDRHINKIYHRFDALELPIIIPDRNENTEITLKDIMKLQQGIHVGTMDKDCIKTFCTALDNIMIDYDIPINADPRDTIDMIFDLNKNTIVNYLNMHLNNESYKKVFKYLILRLNDSDKTSYNSKFFNYRQCMLSFNETIYIMFKLLEWKDELSKFLNWLDVNDLACIGGLFNRVAIIVKPVIVNPEPYTVPDSNNIKFTLEDNGMVEQMVIDYLQYIYKNNSGLNFTYPTTIDKILDNLDMLYAKNYNDVYKFFKLNIIPKFPYLESIGVHICDNHDIIPNWGELDMISKIEIGGYITSMIMSYFKQMNIRYLST